MRTLIEQANRILKKAGFEYAFCGGGAIDLFLGYCSRTHYDIDVCVYWSERDSVIRYLKDLGYNVYEMLGSGRVHYISDIGVQMSVKRNIFACTCDCPLVKLFPDIDKDMFFLDFSHDGLKDLSFIEFLFNDKTKADFLYARNRDIRLPIEKAILYKDGIPYLSPEMCLLYKSADAERTGYQSDFELSYTKMNIDQKRWLNGALQKMYPKGHKWINAVPPLDD